MQLAFSPYSSPEPEGISDVLLAKHRYELVLRKSVPPLIIAAIFFIWYDNSLKQYQEVIDGIKSVCDVHHVTNDD